MSTDAKRIFSRVLSSDKKIRIKLLGDSITHGYGGTGFKEDGEKFVEGYARNVHGYCWANLFKEHMEESFNCEVINNACTGRDIEHIIRNFDKLVDEDDDIVLCAIGTNNRNQYFIFGPKHTKEEHMSEFYENIIKLNTKFKNTKKDVIFMANIPASASNEENEGKDHWKLFKMSDVDMLYKKASIQCGFPLISLYTKFKDYCNMKNISAESLLVDGLHPNDAGYKVMFELIMEELGIIS